jgi:oxygen-dependent protoporphyrinogen oxidase
MTQPFHVVIIGGGISGLSTAWYVQLQAQQNGRPLTYSLLEQSGRWGGKVLTETVDGFGETLFIVEGGPDSFLTQKPWALQLARELELDEELLPTNDAQRKIYVLHRGKPLPMPDGVLLIVPTRFKPFALSPLISPFGKLRMAFDWFIPARRDGQDETLAEFVTRRLGAEALDKIAEPLMAGIYNAEAERQSLLATFPRFRELEEKHGSLIRGMIAGRRAQTSAKPTTNGSRPLSMFMSLAGGMETLVHTLRGRLTGDCRLNTGVRAIYRQTDGRYQLELSGGGRLAADAIVIALPAHTTAALLSSLAPEAAGVLATIRYVSTGTISLAFRREDVPHPLDGFGLVIPRSEKRAINAITWSSTKFNRRAPIGYVLMRVFFGGSRQPRLMEADDEAIEAIVRRELKALLGIEATPLFQRLYRWQRANPQYDVGHLDRVAAIEAALPAGLFVTGSPYRGVGLPDCVHQARQTAARLVAMAH